jgi:Uma2 family endonuclease
LTDRSAGAYSGAEGGVGDPELQLKRWTRKEYDQLIEQGVFTSADRIELLDGLLVVAEPPSAYHYTAIGLIVRALARAFGDGWTIRSQGPLALDDLSEPEPDVAVVRGDLLDFAGAHPSDPVLVVEVTLSSAVLDRRYKSSLYARAGRPEYWVLDLVHRVLEVRREPAADVSAPYGWDYRRVDVLRPGDRVTALAAPGVPLLVADLLPPV